VIAYSLGLFSAVLVATSQILLKIGATRYGGGAFLRQYLNGYVLSGYVLFFLVTVVNVYVFSLVPLKMANIFVAFAYVGVLLFSWLLLGEVINKDRLVGIVLIVVGVGFYVL